MKFRAGLSDTDGLESPIEHVARILRCRHDWGDLYMTMLSTAFDASGHEVDQSHTVTAGFISSVSEWLKFSDKWTVRLSVDGITCFHATEYYNFKNEFAVGWNNNQTRRSRLERDLLDIILQHAWPFLLVSCVVNDDFTATITPEIESGFHVNGYALNGLKLARTVHDWQIANNNTSQVEFVFEEGDVEKGKLIEQLTDDGFPTPIFRYKKLTSMKGRTHQPWIPLQAADWLAYLYFRLCRAQAQGVRDSIWDGSDIPKQFEKLPGRPGIFRVHNLQDFVTKIDILKSVRAHDWRDFIVAT